MHPIDFSKILFPKKLSVTEQEVDISMLSEQEKSYYTNLFRELFQIYSEKKKSRVTVGLAGPTGAGKSVIAALFKEMARQIDLPFSFETITIDAYHYPNAVLASKMSDSGEILKNHKGRFDTYDTEKLAADLKAFAEGDTISFPIYSRKLHDPIENSIRISEKNCLLLVEGLWLLYDKAGWENIRTQLDYSIFVTADKEKVKSAVLARHIKGGKTLEEASHHYDAVDGINFDLVMETKNKADKTIPSYYEII